MLRSILASAILAFSGASIAEDAADDANTSHRQATIDRIVETTRSLDAHYVQPNCPECDRIFAEGELPDWSLQYGTRSGFGGTAGFRIWSDGRIALCTRRACEEFRRCLSVRADPTMLNLLEEQIRRFDVPASGHRMVSVGDTCLDETEHVVRVNVGDTQTGFVYSAPPSCRRGNEVPEWMIDTVALMRAHMEWIRNCQANEAPPASESSAADR